ncbi:hypothetical protein MycrhDRAFT_5653 [Mycolicibacterium rhodesiae JS60]|nr:hypothetical protein MycrhDRAFT_5653 [Mycolicibacterium rhodesiae JS60]
MATTVLAWQSTNWLWNDIGHSLGAFLTSSGFGGVAAVTAAGIAAWQVYRTRNQDLAVTRKEEADRHSDQLWTRFEWVVSNREELGPLTVVEMLLALESDARNHPDQSLEQVLSAHRRNALRRFTEAIARQAPSPSAE